jgi:ParB family chromosome partitioning protein
LQIVYKKIADLKRYEKNNKKHPEKQLVKIVASIKEYGFKNPVLVDKNNVIIAGHGRTLAAERLGMEEVPCIDCSDLNSKQVKALRLMDNKSAELAEWDFDNIKAELEELKLEEFDIDLTGFDSIELDDLLKEKENINLDDFFEENTKPKEKEKKVLICPHCGGEIEVK